MTDNRDSMPSYVLVDEVGVILEKMADREHDPTQGGSVERNLRKDKACDHARRLLNFFRDAVDRGTVVSENPLAWPRKGLPVGQSAASER